MPDRGRECAEKDELDCESRDKGWNWATGDRHLFARCFDIGWKDAKQHDKGERCCRQSDTRNLQADCDEDFCNAGERDPERTITKSRWNHADQVGPAFSPVC